MVGDQSQVDAMFLSLEKFVKDMRGCSLVHLYTTQSFVTKFHLLSPFK